MDLYRRRDPEAARAAPRVAALGVSRRYGGTVALSDVTVEFTHGVTVLLGRNGAGKSTLCRMLAAAEQPEQGTIMRDGEPVADEASLREHRRRCGWLPQSFDAPPAMTVTQFLEYAAWLKEVPRALVSARVAEALEAADLAAVRGRRLGQLSGGLLRRAGIAQAVVNRPDFLVLDEPTAGLDPEQRAAFHRLLGTLADGRSVLVSTHLLEDVAVLARRIVVIETGRLAFCGSIDELANLGGGEHSLVERVRSGFLTVIAAQGRE